MDDKTTAVRFIIAAIRDVDTSGVFRNLGVAKKLNQMHIYKLGPAKTLENPVES